MNEIELTKLFVAYREAVAYAAELEEQIKAEVLQLAESQKIAGVKATYYEESTEYDYEGAASGHPMVADSTIELFTTVTERVRWADVCEHIGLDKSEIPSVEKPARVVVKLA